MKVFFISVVFFISSINLQEAYGGSMNTDKNMHDGSIERVDSTFEDMAKKMPNTWSKKGKEIFYNGKKLEGADSKSFEIINFTWAKDKQHIYFADTIIVGADPKTFETIGGYVRLSNGIYNMNIRQEIVSDFKSFEKIVNTKYYRDSRYVYHEVPNQDLSEYVLNIVKGANPKGFIPPSE